MANFKWITSVLIIMELIINWKITLIKLLLMIWLIWKIFQKGWDWNLKMFRFYRFSWNIFTIRRKFVSLWYFWLKIVWKKIIRRLKKLNLTLIIIISSLLTIIWRWNFFLWWNNSILDWKKTNLALIRTCFYTIYRNKLQMMKKLH